MYKFTKRLTDIFLAAVAFIILFPLMLIITIILLLTGEHEVLFFQQRVGYKNKLFNIWKFASMLKNSSNIGTKEITLRNDPRVTRFGKFLRKTKLNELPQIINVLKGDMSIVGPRPLMEVSFKLYTPEVQKIINDFRPGITGIGSLIFRDEEKIISEAPDAKLMYASIYSFKGQLELWYEQHASTCIDFKIIFLTAWTIVFPKSKLVYKVIKGLPNRPF